MYLLYIVRINWDLAFKIYNEWYVMHPCIVHKYQSANIGQVTKPYLIEEQLEPSTPRRRKNEISASSALEISCQNNKRLENSYSPNTYQWYPPMVSRNARTLWKSKTIWYNQQQILQSEPILSLQKLQVQH